MAAEHDNLSRGRKPFVIHLVARRDPAPPIGVNPFAHLARLSLVAVLETPAAATVIIAMSFVDESTASADEKIFLVSGMTTKDDAEGRDFEDKIKTAIRAIDDALDVRANYRNQCVKVAGMHRVEGGVGKVKAAIDGAGGFEAWRVSDVS